MNARTGFNHAFRSASRRKTPFKNIRPTPAAALRRHSSAGASGQFRSRSCFFANDQTVAAFAVNRLSMCRLNPLFEDVLTIQQTQPTASALA
jgi:hypothetical protein